MVAGKALTNRVHKRIGHALERGTALCDMHPLAVAKHLDPLLQDQLYPMTANQALAKAHLLPATWQASVRAGWLTELRRREESDDPKDL